jgi:hypothetical protein
MFSLSELGQDKLNYVFFLLFRFKISLCIQHKPLKVSKIVPITIKLLHQDLLVIQA